MKIEIDLTANDINYIRTKFDVDSEDDLKEAIIEMISTYMEM